MEDIANLIVFYGSNTVFKAITAAAYMDEDIVYLASAVLGIPLTDFKYYSFKQYRKIL